MTAAALSTKVQTRIGSNRLIQLTNDDSTATSIDTTVLEGACEDAIGQFERLAKVAHDTDNLSHVAILVKGALCFLEGYKGRDSGMFNSLQKEFIRDCLSFGQGVYISCLTTSNLTIDREAIGTRPDMDRNRRVWSNKRQVVQPRESIDVEDDDR